MARTGRAVKRGSESAFWKGGRVKHNGGYVCVHAPSHPKANHGYVLEHVIVAEAQLGHYLPEGAVVHHKDSNRANNDPSNLIVCLSQAEHVELHRQARALQACGHTDWHKCYLCKTYDVPANMLKHRTSYYHSECSKEQRRRKRQENPTVDQRVVRLHHKGETLTAKEWAVRFNVGRDYFTQALKKYTSEEIFHRLESGLKHKKLKNRGDNCAVSKLTAENVAALITEYHLLKQGRTKLPCGTREPLAKKYGVSPNYLSSIIGGNTPWAERQMVGRKRHGIVIRETGQ